MQKVSEKADVDVKKYYRAKIVKDFMNDTLEAHSLYLVRCLQTEEMSTEKMRWYVSELRTIRHLQNGIDSMIHQAELAEAAISSND